MPNVAPDQLNVQVKPPSTDPNIVWAKHFGDCYADPLDFVLTVYPWGEKDTALERFTGPRQWQQDFLGDWGRHIAKRGFDGITPVMPIEMSVVSGHGIGKSAMSAWIIDFMLHTRPHSQGVVTATSAPQLNTKTWAEFYKWHKMMPVDWFEVRNSKQSMSAVHRQHEKWRVDAVTCAKDNSEAFAGLHAASSSPWYLFDEASGVPDEIWEVSDGGLTDGEPHRITFGNGTRNSGRFYRQHKQERERVICRSVDSRTVEGTNTEYYEELAARFGEDSDYAKVRVRGMFPDTGDAQFISSAKVDEAMGRDGILDLSAPAVLGVDVARFGDDKSIIYPRCGRDAKTWPYKMFAKLDTMGLVAEIVKYRDELERAGQPVDAIVVDGTGVGGPVVDRLKELGHKRVFEVHNAGASLSRDYHNRGVECWALMRDSINAGLALPNKQELKDQLTAREYSFKPTKGGNALALESKDDLKKRGEPSPDIPDALALTYAVPVAPRAVDGSGMRTSRNRKMKQYNPYGDL